MKKSLLILILFFQASCKDTGYDYVVKDNPAVFVTKITPLKQLITDSEPVDILWVIDNSGSMKSIQENVIKNTEIFMKEFVLKKTINWKMGLISTDYELNPTSYNEPDKPFLGFDTPFDFNTLNPIEVFQEAVTRLGTSGNPTEKTIMPVWEHLKNYPSFLRPEAQLVIIMVGDEFEQTPKDYMKSDEFLANLVRLKGSIRKLRFYAILNGVDLGCADTVSDQVDYFASKYEYLVNETQGSYFKACADDFGSELSKISEDIVSKLTNSKFYFTERPKVETIRVSFEGEVLASVDESGKRRWFYSHKLNCLVFLDLSFIPLDIENAFVSITYDLDDGFSL